MRKIPSKRCCKHRIAVYRLAFFAQQGLLEGAAEVSALRSTFARGAEGCKEVLQCDTHFNFTVTQRPRRAACASPVAMATYAELPSGRPDLPSEKSTSTFPGFAK